MSLQRSLDTALQRSIVEHDRRKGMDGALAVVPAPKHQLERLGLPSSRCIRSERPGAKRWSGVGDFEAMVLGWRRVNSGLAVGTEFRPAEA